MRRVAECLDLLDGCLDQQPQAKALVAELREQLTVPGRLWPEKLMEAVAELVSPSVWNVESRTYKSIDRRVQHALNVWHHRFDPMTPAQLEYAETVLVWAVRQAAKEAGGDKKKLYPFIHQRIATVVNDETVHERFASRGPVKVDVSDELRRLAA